MILGVDGDHRAGLRRSLKQATVVIAPLGVPRRDHEDLESGVAFADETSDFRTSRRARIGHDDMKGEVGEGSLGVAQAALDPAPE